MYSDIRFSRVRYLMLIRLKPAGFHALTPSRVSFLFNPATTRYRMCIGFQHMLLGIYSSSCCPHPRSNQAILSCSEDCLRLIPKSISHPEGKHCPLSKMKFTVYSDENSIL